MQETKKCIIEILFIFSLCLTFVFSLTEYKIYQDNYKLTGLALDILEIYLVYFLYLKITDMNFDSVVFMLKFINSLFIIVIILNSFLRSPNHLLIIFIFNIIYYCMIVVVYQILKRCP